MHGFIQEVLDDPREYMPFLLLLGGLFLFWLGLCASGIASLCAATPRRRFWLGMVPFVFGVIGVWSQIPFSFESDGHRVAFDLRWLFLAPLVLGGAGLVLWWKMRHKQAPATSLEPNQS